MTEAQHDVALPVAARPGVTVRRVRRVRRVSRAAGFMAATALVLAAGEASGQVVHGRVLNDDGGVPLDLVAIDVIDAAGERQANTVSDSAGLFTVRVPRPGTWSLRLTRIGFADVLTGPVEVASGERVELELRMSVAAVPLEPLRVVGRAEFLPGRLREFRDRAEASRRLGRGRVLFRADLDRMAAPQPSVLLALTPIRAGCRPTILLDGLVVGSARELDAIIYTDALEGVEFYTGPSQMPQEFANRGYCGVALFWTRHDEQYARPLTWRRVFLAIGIIVGGFMLMRE